MRKRKIFAILVGIMAGLFACESGTETERIRIEPPVESGPVVARSAEYELRTDQLEAFASLGAEMRRLAGAETTENRAQLVLEAFSLVAEGRAESLLSSRPVQEEEERLLARLYLTRFVEMLDRQSVAEGDLENAFRDEQRRALATGDSEIYVPTRVDGVAAIVGYFPDLHPPAKGELPQLDREQVAKLANSIFTEARSARDTDGFIQVVRRFMAGNPTVSFKEFSHVPRGQAPAVMGKRLYQMLTEGSGEGLIEPMQEFRFGTMIAWRVGIRPGRGENLEEVRDEITRQIRNRRHQESVRLHIDRLLRERNAQIFYKGLVPASTQESTP